MVVHSSWPGIYRSGAPRAEKRKSSSSIPVLSLGLAGLLGDGDTDRNSLYPFRLQSAAQGR